MIMGYKTWTPLWSGIVDSSLWEESGNVVKVFMTILATKDADHICRLDAYKIGKKCNIDEVEVMGILKLLASPDTRRQGKQDFGGRRIKMVEEGWLILNGQKYRDACKIEMLRAKNRRGQAAFRLKQKLAKEKAAGIARIINASDKFEWTKQAVLKEHQEEMAAQEQKTIDESAEV